MSDSVRRGARTTRALGLALALAATAIGNVAPSARPAVATAAPTTAAFVPLEPFRLADTRQDDCGCDRIGDRTIEIAATAHPDVPEDATALVVSVTAVAGTEPAFVTAYPAAAARPLAATLNARTDRNVSNSAIVSLDDAGALRLFRRTPGDVVVDVTGAFVPTETARAGRFVSMPARRVVDTRRGVLASGPLSPGGGILVPLPADIDADATAVVVNVASVGVGRPGHLTVRPAGTAPATTAFMTVPGTGGVVSNSVIAPVSDDGFVIGSSAGGDLVVDLVGWFTGPSADEHTDGLFVPLDPERLLDTRTESPRVWPGGTRELAIDLPDAAAVVTNVTATRTDRRTFVTAYPAGTPRPMVASLNAAFFEHTIANLTITTVSTRGIAYHAKGGADLVVDLAGYFIGSPVPATRPPAPNAPPRSRVLLVGDSTLRGIELEPISQRAFVGFEPILDAASCRRLLRTSCRSGVTFTIPNTAVEAILGTPGELDIVVVKTGYNDWFSDFPAEFDAVVEAARAKGAHTILWFSYNELVRPYREKPTRAYRENNDDLYRLVDLPQYSDVVLADWLAYSNDRQDWFWDGTHTTLAGSFAIADYASRWIAAIEHRPCPVPWSPGGPILDPCPSPDLIGPVGDPIAIHP